METPSIQTLQQRIQELEAENKQLKDILHLPEGSKTADDREKEELAPRIYDSLPDMVTVYTYEGILRYLISSPASNHTGHPIEKILNKSILDFLSPEGGRTIYENIQKVKARKKPVTGHHTIEVNGITNHYEHRIVPLDERYVIIYCRNVTNQVQQAKRNRDLTDLLDSILNNLPVFLFVKDVRADLKYIYWNNAFAEASGIPATRAIGRTDYEIFPNIADANKFRRDDTDLIQHRTPLIYEEEFTTVSGEIKTVNTHKVLCKLSEDQEVIIGVSIDISEMKKIEEELLHAKQRAEENDKQKSIFLSNMGHEIRTPINAIVGFADVLANAKSPEEQQQCLDVIRLNSDLLQQLISDILDLSKIEAGTLEFINSEFDLGSICANIYEVHRANITSRGINFVYENEGECFPMVGDVNRIMQVINNFLTNAAKFTEQGEICFGFHRTAPNEVYIHVTDTGMGISEEDQSRLFDRFVKLNPSINGTGLGLAICKTIASRLGGRIGVDSTPGKGSLFYLTLPVNPEQKV